MTTARLVALRVGGSPGAWASIGFSVDDDLITLSNGAIRIMRDTEPGVHGWELSGGDRLPPGSTEIDGIETIVVEHAIPERPVDHGNGAEEIDHIVVMSDSLDRTCAAISDATGAALKRVRDLGDVRQGFHRLGRRGVIVEVVERSEPAGASLWGAVFTVADLEAAAHDLGPHRLGPIKRAVQPERRIATVRSSVGLGVPVAMMSR